LNQTKINHQQSNPIKKKNFIAYAPHHFVLDARKLVPNLLTAWQQLLQQKLKRSSAISHGVLVE
jgi:hypothetical protein